MSSLEELAIDPLTFEERLAAWIKTLEDENANLRDDNAKLREDIAKLREENSPLTDLHAEIEQGGECSICMEQGSNMAIKPCMHRFHGDCALMWFRTCIARGADGTCPDCRECVFQRTRTRTSRARMWDSSSDEE